MLGQSSSIWLLSSGWHVGLILAIFPRSVYFGYFFQLGPLGPLGLFELNFPVEPVGAVGTKVTRNGKNCNPSVLAVFEQFFLQFRKEKTIYAIQL